MSNYVDYIECPQCKTQYDTGGLDDDGKLECATCGKAYFVAVAYSTYCVVHAFADGFRCKWCGIRK